MSMTLEVIHLVKKLLKTMLVEMLRLDVPVCPLKVRRRFHEHFLLNVRVRESSFHV